MGKAHNHHHNHTHAHHHAHASKNLGVAFILNSVFAVIELAGGLLTNSVAILSDALHDFGDSLSLGMAWFFQNKSQAESSANFTYGYQRFSLVGAFINAIVLSVGSILIIIESVPRLFKPEIADYKGMLYLAVLGIAVNGIAMFRLRKGHSINEKVVSLHFLEDVLGWVAVLIGALVMLFYHVPVIDPILSILIAFYVLYNVVRNLIPAIRIILQGVPYGVDETPIKNSLLEDPRVESVHDLRLWSLDGMQHVLSVHIVVSSNLDLKTAEQLKENLKEGLKKHGISYATIEVEFAPEHL